MKFPELYRARVTGVAALFTLAALKIAAGQTCFNWMTPEYSTYVSASTDGTKIYSSVVVDGTTGGTCPNTCDHCSQILNPPPVHTPKGLQPAGGHGRMGNWN